MATSTISPEAVAALRDATMTDRTLTLPQVGPKVYAELRKVIQRTGGTWVRKLGTHVYDTDPRPIIAEILGDGAMPTMPRDADKDAAFFRTPDDVADRLVAAARLPDPGYVRILEPSAGDGALVAAIARAYPEDVTTAHLTLVEPDERRRAVLSADGYPSYGGTFEEYAASVGGTRFDVVVMNPPFATPGNPVLWAAHVLLAWDLLADKGTLAAIVPNNIERQHRTVAQVRALVEDYGWTEDLDDDAFKASGTGVRTKILVLEKP